MQFRYQKWQVRKHARNVAGKIRPERKMMKVEIEMEVYLVVQIVYMILLMVGAILDIRHRRVPVLLLAGMMIAAVVCRAANWSGDYKELAACLAMGGSFLLVSKVTDEGMGYGDSLGIVSLAIALTFWNAIEVLAGAFFALALASIFVLVRKKMSRKAGLPFYPFLAGAFCIYLFPVLVHCL